jgi:regulator of protease activity HflC (stomatin/prohibitin superfamily)
VLKEYERGVHFRLGRFIGVKAAGLRWIIPGVDRLVVISLREIVMDVPPQEVITRDNVSVKVNAVLYFRVLHPEKSVIQVENYLYGTSQLAQTTLRSVCGQAELDDLLAERESINQKLQEIIDLQTEPWGVKVRAVEVKQIDLPQEMQRAMAKQAEAEREKRAKVIHAEGEFLAAQRLSEAARVLATEESALQLRYLQTLAEIATEQNSTIVFPIPIDILRPFYPKKSDPDTEGGQS